MNTTATQYQAGQIITDAGELENMLQELLDTMTMQISALEAENYDQFIDLSSEVSKYLALTTQAKAQITHISFEKISKVHKLNQQIGLTLSSRSDELAQRMKKVKSGKQVMRAYRNSV